MALRQGLGSHAARGLHARLPRRGRRQRTRAAACSCDFTLGGTESLAIAPIGDSNHISLSVDWPHPQFAGRFLPRARGLTTAASSASWEISSLAARAARSTSTAAACRRRRGHGRDEPAPRSTRSAWRLVDPVNIYSQADRASKYGILFVLLTFVGFFMFELIKRLPIHPIQYGLVGLALAIFFLLLLSLSEHMAFWMAYLAASVACIGLLGVYLSAVLRSAARGLGFAAMLTLLYAALYGLLVSEDNALVLGSLTAVRDPGRAHGGHAQVDWYAIAGSRPPGAGLSRCWPGRRRRVRGRRRPAALPRRISLHLGSRRPASIRAQQ